MKSAMASSHLLLSFTILALLTFAHSFTRINSVHDLLRSKGLPGGLFPINIKKYSLEYPNYLLEVHMEAPCLTKYYESHVIFDSVVRANLSFRGLIGVEGLSQQELFLWLPVKDIIVSDPASGIITFDIGVAYKLLAYSTFDEPRYCVPLDIRSTIKLKCETFKVTCYNKIEFCPHSKSCVTAQSKAVDQYLLIMI